MSLQPTTSVNRSQTLIIIGIAAITLVSMGWYASSNWYQSKTAAKTCNLDKAIIYDQYKFAVPLVYTEYIYNVSIKGSAPVPFTLNDAGEWTLYNKHSTPIRISGTAFFVSKTGHLITNKHVVEPWHYNEELALLSKTLSYFIRSHITPANITYYLESNWENRYQDNQSNSEDIIEELVAGSSLQTAAIAFASNTNSDAGVIQASIADERQYPVEDTGYITPSDIKITPQRVSVHIVMQGQSSKADNLILCNVLNPSANEAIDLALLQTADEKLPLPIKNVFALDNKLTATNNIHTGMKAYMLSYPDESLPASKTGRPLQMHEGRIVKKSDDIALQYDIASIYGTSGSPIINECGQLIAINYTGSDRASDLSSGILARFAADLFKKN